MDIVFLLAVTVPSVQVIVMATSIAILRATITTDNIVTRTPVIGKRITMTSSGAQSIEIHGIANQGANVGVVGIVAQAGTAGTTEIATLMRVIMDPLAMKRTYRGRVRITIDESFFPVELHGP